ncbi:hypothetical protein RUM43_001546 [Polyplax serrata]|uniref:Bms1-type G domain-containing protein n=1 Tax=Polyplax serrata TaxID=468196 RepID=A0AAN8SEG4_POLSC
MGEEYDENGADKKKAHRVPHSGRKAEKKKAKKQHNQELTSKQRNPKAFAFNSAKQAERRFRRKQDLDTKKQHIPVVDRTPVEPPPIVVAVVGPPKVGKSTLIHNLVKHFTKQPLTTIKGPVTMVVGKKLRITLIECNNDINSMIDLAKVADLVLLLVDASFGFEMEIFEFLNICQIHGMPKILGVLTHLDLLKNNKQLKKTKKTLKHRFWTEVYAGAKLFYLSGILHGEYLKNDIRNLGRFITVIKLRPLVWRSTHPYVLVDRLEDITDPEKIRQNSKCDRNVCLYGFARGIPLNKENSIHIPGCGDTKITNVSFLPDPCPLPERKKRSLLERERTIYAPFSGVGGVVYDKDAVYVELAGSHSFQESKTEESELIDSMLTIQGGIDVKRDMSEMKIFSDSKPIVGHEFEDHGKFTKKDVIQEEEKETVESDEDSEESSDENEEVEEAVEKETSYTEERIEEEGRVRRRVVFKKDNKETSEGNENESSDENSSDECEADEKPKQRGNNIIKERIKNALNKVSNKLTSGSDSSGIESECEEEEDKDFDEEEESQSEFESEEEDDEEPIMNGNSVEESGGKKRKAPLDCEGAVKKSKLKETENYDFETSAIRWKENLAQKAAQAFLERQNNSQNLYKLVYGKVKRMLDGYANEESETAQDEAKEEIGGIFQIVGEKQRNKIAEKDALDENDSSIFPCSMVRNWTSEDNKILIRDCFVTGKWDKSEDAEELLKMDDAADDAFGDFEDLETGEKHVVEEPPVDPKQKLLEKKKKLKKKFDEEYDDKEEYSYYTDLKAQMDQQAQINKSEFEGLADDLRVELEGYRPGMYIRVELSKMPCELVENFDPTYPLIIGGLLPIEENIGFIQVRLKKHRWYNKILKTKDPLIISLGWRRFQSLLVYSKLEDNMRQRMLKYTPEHLSCMGHFYGPITPQGTGFLAVQYLAAQNSGFRIACTGAVVEVDKSVTITKKLKLVGTPLKIFKKTAFIEGMFNSILEVGKFEGAKIRTVSGIRGQIKKAISKPEGAFRATFEDKIKLSDLVFCRTWYAVDVPKFYNPMTTMLMSPEKKSQWEGMKTMGQLKRERNIKNEAQKDSLYTPIVRKEKTFKPLTIPKALQKALPYKDKPKNPAQPKKNNVESTRVAVIKEPHEEKVAHLMKMIKTNYQHKKEEEKKAMIERVKKYEQTKKAEEMRRLKRQKELRRHVFRTLGLLEKDKRKRGGN